MQSGFIPQEMIQRVREAVDLVEVVSGHLSLKKTGQNYTGLCPFHSEKTPSFVVSPSKQVFHCFGCGAGGDVFGWMMRMENRSFPEAVQRLAERARIELPSRKARPSPPDPEQEKLFRVQEEAAQYFRRCLLERPEGRAARDYLKKRGISHETEEAFRVGYALPSWDGLMKMLVQAGWPSELLERAGLVIRRDSTGKGFYDRFRHRLIFPITDLEGRVIGFGGRALDDAQPKYLNSPETPIYSKGRHLYAFSHAKEAIRTAGSAVVVEGYFDAITAHQAGFKQVTATLGTALTPNHLQLMRRFTHRVRLLFDPDRAGTQAAMRTVDLFIPSGLTVEVVRLSTQEDPDAFIQSQGAEAFRGRLENAVPLLDFALEQAVAPVRDKRLEDKLPVVQSLLTTIGRLQSRIEQGHYLKRLADLVQMEERDLRSELARLKTRTQPRPDPGEGPPETAEAGLPKEEELLIHLMLHHRLPPEILSEVSPTAFADRRAREIVAAWRASAERFGRAQVSHLLETFETDQGCSRVVTELSVREPSYEDPERIAHDCLDRLRQKRLRVELKGLEQQIRAAELEGRMDVVRSLESQILNLRRGGLQPAGPAAE
jgi:DNA primase